MSAGQFKRIGAFVGTVATVVAVDRIARKRNTDVIGAIGKSFSSSLGAATDRLPRWDVSEEPERYPMPFPIPYFWAGIYHRLWSLFPQVLTPFELETWEQAACRIYQFEPMTWEDAETLAELVHVLKSNCGTDGV